MGEETASMRRDALRLIAAAIAALVLASPAGAKPPEPAVARCALGKLPSSLRTFLPEAIGRQQKRYAASLDGAGAADRARAAEAFATGVAAYFYGMPTVVTRLTVQRFPLNTLIGVGQLSTAAQRAVVAPNHDTLYSVSRVQLGDGPVIIDAPATGGRYSVIQLLDTYTNAFAYIGSGAERERDQSVALVAPGWQGSVPAGVRVVQSPTKLVWLLGRTLVDGPADVAAATDLMRRYALTPLAAWTGGQRNREVVINSAGSQPPVVLPEGLAFFDSLDQALAADPPPAADDCALRAFARFGIAPGQTPSTGSDPLVAAALNASAATAVRLVDRAVDVTRRDSRRHHDGWAVSHADAGRFGVDYGYRAVVADVGLASNVRSEAYYPQTDVDDHGRKLDGRHDYVVSFPAGGLPPVRAFWSLTLYDADRFLVANPIDRYTIGDRTAGLRYGRKRTLKVYVRHDPPPGAKAANWLPAPEGPFELHLRLYEPKRAAINGSWSPPTIERVR